MFIPTLDSKIVGEVIADLRKKKVSVRKCLAVLPI